MYPNLLYCNLPWVQWTVKVTWTAQAVRGDWVSLQSVWGWLPTANVPARQFKTSRDISTQPATLEITAVLETPWAVKKPITHLQAAEVDTKQAGSSLCILLSGVFRLELEIWLLFAKMLSCLLCFSSSRKRIASACVVGLGKCEWPKCVHNSQDLGRHSVNTKPNDFLAHFYEPRRCCKDWMQSSSTPLNA